MAPRRIRVERLILAERRIRAGRHRRTELCIRAERRIKPARLTRAERRAKVVSRAKICRGRAVRPVAAVAVAAGATSGINAQSGKVARFSKKIMLRQNVRP
jgi:hypothetical protein